MAEELTSITANQIVTLIRSKEVSPVAVVEAHLRRIESVNPKLNAIVTLADDALDQARVAERELMSGNEVGTLLGLPITIKDTIQTKGLRTTSGSRLLMYHSYDRDATVVARLKSAGAIILGKTNTPEMAAYYECDNPVFGHTNNPYDLNRTAGGSSGGEAAAIAACLSPAGIGSDLSGSIRLPAHFCGIAGLKPTTGSVPVDGHVPEFSGSLSLGGTLGPMARSIEDLKLLFDVIADHRHVQTAVDVRGLRVAWYVNDGIAPVDDEIARAVEQAAEALRDSGFEIAQMRPPGVEHGLRLWVELFSNHFQTLLRQFYRGHEAEAGPQIAAMLKRVRAGRDDRAEKMEIAERQAKAVVERQQRREELLRWMKTTPVILAPVGAVCAFEHGASRVDVHGESISVFRAFSYSQTFNVFGLPSVAVPVGRNSAGLPIGVQIVGRPFAEDAVLAVAAIIEHAVGRRPPSL